MVTLDYCQASILALAEIVYFSLLACYNLIEYTAEELQAWEGSKLEVLRNYANAVLSLLAK